MVRLTGWKKHLLWIDLALESIRIPLFLLSLVVLLRLPNLTEPYWYGDEGIYLTIGNALHSGSRLYADIIDHKTPLIYYFAIVPSQLWFRVFLLFWMGGTTLCFYAIAHKILKFWPAVVASVFFILMTSLPWFEGNIPNGELFMMGFVLLGTALLLQTDLGKSLWDKPPSPNQTAKPKAMIWQLGAYLSYGIPFGLAILTKVPSLFDFVAILGLWWFSFTRHLPVKLHPKHWWVNLKQTLKYCQKALPPAVITAGMFTLGMVLPIGISILYFWSRGTLSEYAQFGLLYNFHYAQNWSLPFTSPILVFAFSLIGKFVLVAGVWVGLTLAAKWLPLRMQVVLGWLALSYFAALLSNRPYPHYFMQIMPPLALAIGLLAAEGTTLLRTGTKKMSAVVGHVFRLGAVLGLASLLPIVLLLLRAGLYPTVSYYQTFWKLMTGQITKTEYQYSFNYLMADNYRASAILKAAEEKQLFIWGTNPTLYAQSQTVPVGRFTVAFHIKDLKVEAETIDKVMAAQPRFIVVMNDDKDTLPGLQTFLSTYYMPNTSFQHFTLWKHL